MRKPNSRDSRAPAFLAVAFIGLLGVFVRCDWPRDTLASQPLTPPGPAVVIVPQPTPAPVVPPVIPTPDELNTFEIVASIGGAEATDEIVKLPVGKLLTLTLRGVADSEGGGKRPAFWCLSRETSDISIYPEDGHHVTFSAPADAQGAYLFVVSVSAPTPAERPLVAMRWVVVGNLPQPPPIPPVPDPDVPTPVPPTPPQPVEGKRSLVIVRESTNDTAALARLLINLRDGAAAQYLALKGHTFSLLDPDDRDPDGTTSDLVEQWRPFFAGMTLPVVFEIDAVTNKIVHKYSLPVDATADNVIESLRSHGG